MLYAVISGFVASAALLPLLHRYLGERSSLVAALVPLGLTAWFATCYSRVVSGEALVSRALWVPEIHLDLAFRLDGLSLLFALLISGIGALVIYLGVPAWKPVPASVRSGHADVHGVHARCCPVGQSHPAVRVLGADQFYLLPVDRFRP